MSHTYHIRENSWLAYLAAKKLQTHRIAVTLGNSIHLWNTRREDFLKDIRWLRHELCHIKQYRDNGFFRFLWLYFIENIRHGYEQNKFEIEARAAEDSHEPPEFKMFK